MVSLYGRALKSQRAYGKRPKAKGKNISLLGVMTLAEGLLDGLSLEGGITGEVFLWFIETLLCPKLWPGAVVVMDRLTKLRESVLPSRQSVLTLSTCLPIRLTSTRLSICGRR
ncbi:MAG: hypothetical protein AAFR31_16585 [Cyanobacteria bacterium J06627_8]